MAGDGSDGDGSERAAESGPKPRITSRVPDTIEGHATDLTPPASSAPNPPPESQVDTNAEALSFEAADAPLDQEIPHPPAPEGPVTDSPMPGEVRAAEEPIAARTDELSPPKKRGYGGLIAGLFALLVAAGAGVWLFADGGWDLLTGAPPPSPPPARTATITPPPSPRADSSAKPIDGGGPRPASPFVAPTPSPTASPPEPRKADSPSAPTVADVKPAPTPEPRKPEPQPVVVDAKPPAASEPKPIASAEPKKPDMPPVTAAGPSATAPPAASPAAANDPRFADLDRRTADLDRRLADLDGKLAAVTGAPPKPVPATTAALDAQATRLGKIDETLLAIDRRLGAMEKQLSAPKTEVRAPQAPDVGTRDVDSAAARIVVAQGLLGAIQSGAPFTTQIAALRALGAEGAGLSRLSALAEAGVPTVAQLRDRFTTLRPKLKGSAKADPGGNWGQNMMARLSSLVSIRPVAERSGPSPEAIASRADAALGRGDVAAALGEMRALPASEAAIAKDWTDAAARRVDAESDARATIAASLATLAKPKS